jgi:hypothetical protein
MSHSMWLTDPLIRWAPNKWLSICREIPVSADKMFWTSNKPEKWTPCICIHFLRISCHKPCVGTATEQLGKGKRGMRRYRRSAAGETSVLWNNIVIIEKRHEIRLEWNDAEIESFLNVCVHKCLYSTLSVNVYKRSLIWDSSADTRLH